MSGKFVNGVYQDYSHVAFFEIYGGVKGTGKTTAWLKAIKAHPSWVKFVFDHQDGEFSERMGVPSVSTADELIKKSAKGGYVVFDYRPMFHDKATEKFTSKQVAFDWFCEFVFTTSGTYGGNKLFCCDELGKMVGQRYVCRAFQDICDEGRRRGLDVVGICHGPNLMHNSIRNEVTRAITFRQDDKTALEFYGDKGIDVEEIRALPDGCWISRANTGEVKRGGKAFRAKQA
jgi:hypothetical protein